MTITISRMIATATTTVRICCRRFLDCCWNDSIIIIITHPIIGGGGGGDYCRVFHGIVLYIHNWTAETTYTKRIEITHTGGRTPGHSYLETGCQTGTGNNEENGKSLTFRF